LNNATFIKRAEGQVAALFPRHVQRRQFRFEDGRIGRQQGLGEKADDNLIRGNDQHCLSAGFACIGLRTKAFQWSGVVQFAQDRRA
jgi:hypothetical protein